MSSAQGAFRRITGSPPSSGSSCPTHGRNPRSACTVFQVGCPTDAWARELTRRRFVSTTGGIESEGCPKPPTGREDPAGRIAETAAAHSQERRAPVNPGDVTTLDMKHSPSGYRKRVCAQRRVASPREGLGTHDGRGTPSRELREAREAGGEVLGLHVVREATKRGVTPAEVARVGPRVAQPAQSLQVSVADLDRMEGARQRRTVELRVVTRPGNGANIHHLRHPISPEQLDELWRGTGGMADRVEDARRARSAGTRHHATSAADT